MAASKQGVARRQLEESAREREPRRELHAARRETSRETHLRGAKTSFELVLSSFCFWLGGRGVPTTNSTQMRMRTRHLRLLVDF